MALRPGESLAIYGPSGCGKSTIINALQGTITLTRGELLLENLPLVVMGLPSLRHHSASVMQDDGLLSGSLLDNIAFGEIRPDPAEAMAAARIFLTIMLITLPDGHYAGHNT